MDVRELSALFEPEPQRKAPGNLLPAVAHFEEVTQEPSELARARPSFERVSLDRPDALMRLMHSMDADLKARIRAIAQNAAGSRTQESLDVLKVQAIGDQLCYFGMQCDLAVEEPSDPNQYVRLPELYEQLGLLPDSVSKCEKLLQELEVPGGSDEHARTLHVNLQLYVRKAEQAFAAARALVEHLDLSLVGYFTVHDSLRVKYLDDLCSWARQLSMSTSEATAGFAKDFETLLLLWHSKCWAQTDGQLLELLGKLHEFCSPVMNVFMFRLSQLREPEQSQDAQQYEQESLVKRMRLWRQLLQRILEAGDFVKHKSCPTPETPSAATLQFCVAELDRAEGVSPSRTAACDSARLLLANASLVGLVQKLWQDVEAAYQESKADVTRLASEFKTVYGHYREQLSLQTTIVRQLRARFVTHDRDAREASRSGPPEAQLARHSAAVRKMTELKPELDKAEVHLQRLTEHYGRASKVASGCDVRLPDPGFAALRRHEARARARLLTFCEQAATQLEQLRAKTSDGKSTQVRKLESACLTRLDMLCLQRDSDLTEKLRALPRALAKLQLDLKELARFVPQLCELRGPARFSALRQRLLRLDAPSELRRFVESRAGFVLALHLYRRLRALLEWKPQKDELD